MPKQKKENQLVNLLVNIILPTIVLVRFSTEAYLGPVMGVVVALSFPIAYGVWDFARTRDYNLFSIIGFVNILLTGGIALFEIPPQWLAVKEAAVPLVLGILILVFQSKYPFVEKLLHEAIDYESMHQRMQENKTLQLFQASVKKGTLGVAGSFLLSSVLNYILARAIVTSDPGTEAFASELGKLTALSYPVIAIPSMIVLTIAMIYVLRSLAKQTGLSLEQILSSKSSPNTSE